MSKVLLPLDSSEFSRQAVLVAADTLDAATTQITLLHVSSPPVLPEERPKPPEFYGAYLPKEVLPRVAPSHPVYLDELRASMIAEFERRLGKDVTVLEAQGFTVRTEVRFGDPAEEIVSEAREGYDLLVMATHGRSGLGRVLMGSVAETVMRNVHMPVMMFKPQPKTVPV